MKSIKYSDQNEYENALSFYGGQEKVLECWTMENSYNHFQYGVIIVKEVK